jgi:hypothetical protein
MKSRSLITEEEWKARRLCGDESCIGVIGKDGRCKECGRPADQAAEAAEAVQPAAAEPVEGQTRPCSQAVFRAAPEDEWANRRLCSDGNCIGVIGTDGRCLECGKPYTGEPD